MSAQPDFVTVYRSMDAGAEEESEAIRRLLVSKGIAATTVDDSAPEVPEGTFEVRVPGAVSKTAEKLIVENTAQQTQEGDPSGRLDLETVFQAEGGTTSEMEAMSVKNLLEFNGLEAVMVGDSVLPNLGFEVRVPRDQAALARQLIANAEPAEQKD
jgi:hypothetical protein